MCPDIISHFNKSGCVSESMGIDRKTTIAFPFHAGSDVNLWEWRTFYLVKAKNSPAFLTFQVMIVIHNRQI